MFTVWYRQGSALPWLRYDSYEAEWSAELTARAMLGRPGYLRFAGNLGAVETRVTVELTLD